MKNRFLTALRAACGLLLALAHPALGQAQTITSFAPASGPAGTSVTFTGTALSTVTGVRFGTGTLTTNFVAQSATSLTVLVPVVAITGTVRLTTNTGAGVSSATNFTYTPRPAGLLAVLSPAGPLDGCAARTLTATASSPAFATGAGFNSYAYSVAVQADGKVLVGGNFTSYQGTPANGLIRLNADGTRDAGFATGTGFNSVVRSLAVQADGKVLVGYFTSYNGTAGQNYLVRLNADGSRDATFVTGAGFNGYVFSVAVQADGQVLVGGAFTSYNGTAGQIRLLRLNADGSRDASFVTGTGFNIVVTSVAMQADGKVLVGGYFTSYNGTTGQNRLVRLNADGTRDATFNTGTGLDSGVISVAVQADGKVLAGGTFTSYQGTQANRLIRLNADGTRDAGFATGTGFNNDVYSVAVQADGQVLAGGYFTSYNGTTGQKGIIRLNADGTRDATFTTGTGFDSAGLSVAVQADGQVLVGGNFASYNGTTNQNSLLRLNADGTRNAAATAVAGASFTFVPGNTTTNPLVTSAAGSYSATASLNGETSAASNAVVLTACPVPVLSSAADNPVARGGLVTLNGTGLAGATGVTFARSGFTAVTLTTFSSNTATALAFALPLAAPNANGTYDVTVTNANGTSAPLNLSLTDNVTWNGSAGIAWATATNWSPPAVPNPFLNIAVVAAAPAQPIVTGTQLVQSVTVGDGGVLTLAPAAGLTTTQNVLLNGGSALAQGAASELYLGTDLTNYGATFALDPTSEVGFGGGPLSHTINGTSAVPFQVLTVGERNLSGTGDALHLAVPVSVARKLALSHQSTVDVNVGTPGRLTLLSTPAATALVVQDATSSVLCTATVQRALALANPGRGYRHYASPVSGNALGDLATATFTPVFSSAYNSSTTALPAAGFPTVFGYDQSRLATAASPYTGFDRGWFSPTAATPFAPGTGYAVNLAGTELVDFVGVPRTGNLALTLPRATGSTGGEGLHLVGNPYPAPIDWSLVNATTDRPGLDAAFYVFESSSQYGGSYRSAVNGVGASNYIGLGQGFFVRVTAGQTGGTLTFRNTHRLTDETLNVPVHRGAADTRPLVQLALAGNGAADNVYVYAEAGATSGTDAAFDAVKLANPSGLNLSSAAATGEALAIDGRPAFGAATVIPLNVAVPQAGRYTLTAAAVAYLGGTTATLVDNLTGTRTVLAPGTAYRFVMTTTTAPGRFFLNLAPAGAPLASATAALEAQVQLYPNPTTGRLTVRRPAGAAASAVLLNALDQVVQTLALPTAETPVNLSGLASGVYSLRLTVDGQPVVKRLVVE